MNDSRQHASSLSPKLEGGLYKMKGNKKEQ